MSIVKTMEHIIKTLTCIIIVFSRWLYLREGGHWILDEVREVQQSHDQRPIAAPWIDAQSMPQNADPETTGLGSLATWT